MRKRIIENGRQPAASAAEGWLDLAQIASVEVTSENPAQPIEMALVEGGAGGWRAGSSGEQTVRLRFDAPQRIRRILIEIHETTSERTQELTLAWGDGSGLMHEIVRQRWTFSPLGSIRECEDYAVALDAVNVLELRLQPDVARSASIATMAKWRVA